MVKCILHLTQDPECFSVIINTWQNLQGQKRTKCGAVTGRISWRVGFCWALKDMQDFGNHGVGPSRQKSNMENCREGKAARLLFQGGDLPAGGSWLPSEKGEDRREEQGPRQREGLGQLFLGGLRNGFEWQPRKRIVSVISRSERRDFSSDALNLLRPSLLSNRIKPTLLNKMKGGFIPWI